MASSRADVLEAQSHLVCALAGLEAITLVEAITDEPGTSRIQFAAGDAQVSLAGLIDVAAELARLRKERDRAEADMARSQGKLANDSFVAKAPADVVQGERDRVADLERSIADLDAQITQLEDMDGA